MQRNDGVLDELEEMFDRCDEDGDRRIGFDVNHDGDISCQEPRTWWPKRPSAAI